MLLWGWNEAWSSTALPLLWFIEEHPRGRERGPDFWYLLWCLYKRFLVQVIKPAKTKSKRMNGLYSQLCSIISSKFFTCVFLQSCFVFSLKFHPEWSSVILNRTPEDHWQMLSESSNQQLSFKYRKSWTVYSRKSSFKLGKLFEMLINSQQDLN